MRFLIDLIVKLVLGVFGMDTPATTEVNDAPMPDSLRPSDDAVYDDLGLHHRPTGEARVHTSEGGTPDRGTKEREGEGPSVG